MTTSRPFESATLAVLRIGAGLGFFSHGAQKMFGWFGGFGPDGGTADLMTRFGAAGVIEVVCGLAIVLGLFTRPLALLASGQMAVAYGWAHVAGQGSLFWWANGGELAMVYAFLWLYVAVRGPGAISLDAWLAERGAVSPTFAGIRVTPASTGSAAASDVASPDPRPTVGATTGDPSGVE